MKPVQKKSRTKYWINHLLRLIGLGLFIWILSQVDLKSIRDILREADPWLVALGVAMAAPTVAIRAWRLWLILATFGLRIPYLKTLVIRLIGAASGDMMPGRTGEVISIAYLQKEGLGIRDPALTLILDRLFDFVILAVLAIAGLTFIGNQVIPELETINWILGLFAAGFVAMIVLILVLKSKPELTTRIIQKVLPRRWYDTLNELWLAKDGSKSDHPLRWDVKTVIYVALASLLSFAFLFLRGYFLARSISIDISLPYLAATMAITTLLQLIPVSNVLGIGTREVSLIYLFGLVGISAELAVGFSFLIVFALLIQDLVGLILWWRFPLDTPLAGTQGKPARSK